MNLSEMGGRGTSELMGRCVCVFVCVSFQIAVFSWKDHMCPLQHGKVGSEPEGTYEN